MNNFFIIVLDGVGVDLLRTGFEINLAECVRQSARGRIHVADVAAAPLRPVGGGGGQGEPAARE